MFRCPTCGRPLVGLRLDHPVHCAIRAGSFAPAPPAPKVATQPRIQIREGEAQDPFLPADWFGSESRRFVA